MANAAAAALSRLERLVPRQAPSRTTLLYALYTFGLFLLFLGLTFPHGLVARRTAQRISEETGWKLRFDDAWLVPWDGYRFANVRLLAGDVTADPWLGARRLSLRPSLTALFGGRLSAASFRGEAYDGRFSGWAERDGKTTVRLAWEGLALARYPHLAGLVQGEWGGTLSGELDLSVGETLRDVEGRGRLQLRDGSLAGGNARGFTIPDLSATAGDAEFEIKAGRLEIRSMKLTGAEIDADVRGQVYLRAPLTDSVVNATVSVKPLPGTPPGVEALLQMLNRGQRPAGGTYTLTLYGMLKSLRVR